MTVGEVCSREVVIVQRNEALIAAAKLMRQYHVGDVVVVEEQEEKRIPIGILTDRDLVVKVLARELDPRHLTVAEVMSAGVETVGEAEEVFPTAERMCALGIRRMPVVDSAGGLVGILTLDDLIDLLAEELRLLAAVAARQQRREVRQT
ncbi:MAG: CBS domain-containing protein [Methylohalobius sp.]